MRGIVPHSSWRRPSRLNGRVSPYAKGAQAPLTMIDLLARSFTWLPVGAGLAGHGWSLIPRAGAAIFSAGLLLSLPLLAVLLVTNTALGVLTRAAPQLNLFAIGFPVTMIMGFSALILLMSNFGPVVQNLFERGFEAVPVLLEALTPAAG